MLVDGTKAETINCYHILIMLIALLCHYDLLAPAISCVNLSCTPNMLEGLVGYKKYQGGAICHSYSITYQIKNTKKPWVS